MISRLLLGLTLASMATPLLAKPLTIPPLKYHQRVLPNGLQVLSIVDHSSPVVSVQVWYHVGSKDDPQGRSGFAHLFEHLMFKSTKHMKAEEMDRLTEDVGGANNASTGDDITNYFEVVPSNHLETLLWAEADRMAYLTVDQANFKSERAVVEEEYRQSVLAQPYGRFFNALDAKSYRVHPYKRPTIGSIPELEAASLQDVLDFHRTFYRPDNATLIVVGDFEPAQLKAWVDQYFGDIKKPDSAIPQVTAVEPAWKKDRSYTVRAPDVPLPAVAVTWLAPPAASKDAAALRVASALLGRGESSRLYQALVYHGQQAAQLGFEADLRKDKGLLVAYAIVAHGKSPAKVRDAMLAQVNTLMKEPIDAGELAKVKTQLLTSALERRQTAMGKGFAIGQATLLEGDPSNVNSDLEDLQAVTAADVQRVLKQYVGNTHHVTITYLAEAAKPATAATAAAATKGATP